MSNNDWSVLKNYEDLDNWLKERVDRTKPLSEQTEEVQEGFDRLIYLYLMEKELKELWEQADDRTKAKILAYKIYEGQE